MDRYMWVSVHGAPSDSKIPLYALTCSRCSSFVQRLLAPRILSDGTREFVAPIADGHMPLISLKDIGWWARFVFDHRTGMSGKELEIAGDWISWPELVQTFTRVTGMDTRFVRVSIDEWLNMDGNSDLVRSAFLRVTIMQADLSQSVGIADVHNAEQQDARTKRQTLSTWWRLWRDDICTRDMDFIRKIHADGYTLEVWLRAGGAYLF
jgi:hypothetical protein